MKSIHHYLRLLRAVCSSLYFNFHYLPWRQAVHLPILLYQPRFLKCKGKILLESKSVRLGMIRLGFPSVGIYPKEGFSWENQGGTVTFAGAADIGSGSSLCIGRESQVYFGQNFISTARLKLVSSVGIHFENDVLMGWDCLLMDTNFHALFDTATQKQLPSCGPIHIGAHNWFAKSCTVLHSVETPEHCTFSLNTVVTRHTPLKPKALIGGQPAHILRENVIRDVAPPKPF